MTALDDLKAFDVAGSAVSLWVFRSTVSGGVPSYRGRWLGMSDRLDAAVKAAVTGGIGSITETLQYDILAQNNEGSALAITVDETYAALIAERARNETPNRKVLELRHLENITFYAVKMVTEGSTLFAVRKADNSWKTKKSRGVLKIVVRDDELDLDDRPSFNVSPFFDFYILGEHILISEKKSFESILSYRAGHAESFQTLQTEPEFSGLFADMASIVAYVGSNKIQLRRVLAIQQKGHYRDAEFMANLKTHHAAMNLSIGFDDDGLIVPTPETCRDIFQALLDHRLDSRLSRKTYDVPNAELVG